MTSLLVTIALLGCGNQADPPATISTAESKPVTIESEAQAPDIWSSANIGQMKPQPPQEQALTQHPLTATRGIERAMDKLSGVVQAHAKNPDDPWALGHGILVQGSDMQLPDGSSAVDHLFATYAQTFEVGQTVTALVTKVDPAEQKISLSIRALDDKEQRAALKKLAAQQSASQKSTLGDLLTQKLAEKAEGGEEE